MIEIEFSVMEGSAGQANSLLPMLREFEKQHHIHVNLVGIPWSKGWGEIAKFGIYGHGPDLSAVGTTWIGSLASMRALRPFSLEQVRSLGGAESFFESSWRTGFLSNDPTIWAIPWLGDALVIYYWKEALEKAGVENIALAFATDEALVETLEKLQKSGIGFPLALNVTNTDIILHEAAHWVWAAGGDFVAPDSREVAFNQPAAIQGWKNYFGLRSYISPDWLVDEKASGDSFLAEKSAIQMGGPYMGVADILRHPDLRNKHLGIIPVSGASYVGGASFVLWQYSPRNQEAFELVRFLLSQQTSIPASPHSYELPTRRDAVNLLSVEHDIFYPHLQAMQVGRSFPTMRLWGSVEDKLIIVISNIWADLFANPHQDMDNCLHKHLDPLAKRLNIILGDSTI